MSHKGGGNNRGGRSGRGAGGGGGGGRGRGRGGGGGGGGGRGRGGGGGGGGGGQGFVPFSGFGQALGGPSFGPSLPGYINSPRGGRGRGGGGGRGSGRGFGRGRGGSLSAQGQNQVGFDYTALSSSSRGRDHRYGNEDDSSSSDNEGGNDDHQSADFSIEPPKGYQHKHKPHLETPSAPSPPLDPTMDPALSSLSASAATPDRAIAAIIPTGPRAGAPIYPSASAGVNGKPNFYKNSWHKPATPTIFPDYHTTRGSGFGDRPPEENEDAKYLAGIPGLRRPGGQGRGDDRDRRRNNFRSGDPAHNDDRPLRKPLTFVKATGEWKDGKFVAFDADKSAETAVVAKVQAEAEREQSDATMLERKAMQEQAEAFTAGGERPKHAGLGFARVQQQHIASAPRQEEPRREPEPDHDIGALADEMDVDDPNAVADFLRAFPGPRELGPDEGMVDDLIQQPSVLVPSSTATAAATPGKVPGATPHLQPAPSQAAGRATTKPRTSPSYSSDEEEEIILIAAKPHDNSSTAPHLHGGQDELGRFVKSDSEEERQLNTILDQQQGGQHADDDDEDDDDDAPGVGYGDPFVIDLTGDPPRLDASDSAPFNDLRTHRFALGDADAPDDSEGDDEDDDADAYEINMTQRQPRGVGKKARNAAKKARRRARAKGGKKTTGGGSGGGLDIDVQDRVPREGDSDLDWGSDGPPGVERDDIEQDVLALAAAGITFKEVAVMDVETPRTFNDEDAMLRQAIEASLGSASAPSAPAAPVVDIPIKKKQSLNQAKKRAVARNWKDNQAAVLADYLENVLAQEVRSDDGDGNDDGSSDGSSTFEGDVVEERVQSLVGARTDSASGKHAKKDKLRAVPPSDNLDKLTELDAMICFMHGMDPQKEGRHKPFGDVAGEADMKEEEWMTEESDDEGEDVEGEILVDVVEDVEDAIAAAAASGKPKASLQRKKSARRKDAFEESESKLLVEDSDDERLAEQLRKILDSEDSDEDDLSLDSDDDDEEDDDDDDDDESESESVDDDSVDDGNMFAGNFAWEEENEAFVAQLSNSVGGGGSGRKAQKRIFKAIEKGDFSRLQLDGGNLDVDLDLDLDDPINGVAPAKRGKNKDKNWKPDDLWAEELQQQWHKERSTKVERQAAALNPFPSTHKKGKKKADKKARRAAKREAKAKGRASGWSDNDDDGLLMLGLGGRNGYGANATAAAAEEHELGRRFATSLSELDEQIKLFLADTGKSTLTLPPMDKRSRAQVHMLANAYTLKSKSKGKGKDRFPTLVKTSRSDVVVDHQKVRCILLGNVDASFGLEGAMKGYKKGSSGCKNTVGATGLRGLAPKNREGAEVGWGAEKIGADNVGHRLLAAMGWTEGKGIGVSGGIADPVSATVKVSKGGLGW